MPQDACGWPGHRTQRDHGRLVTAAIGPRRAAAGRTPGTLRLVVIASLASVLAACGGPASAPTSAPTTRVVTGLGDEQITLPLTINRIGEQIPAHTATDIMLGAGPRLVAIPMNVKTIPFLKQVYPPIVAVSDLFQNGGGVNMEDLLKLKPDLISTVDAGRASKRSKQSGFRRCTWASPLSRSS